MRAFTCDDCGQLVFFENTSCLRCGAALAIDPRGLALVVVGPDDIRCANADLIGCGWLVDRAGDRCRSCVLTRTRPNDDDAEAMEAFASAEADKRRLVFQLLGLGLPVRPRDEAAGTGVAFDLLSSRDEPVMTGHASGIITLDLAETDDSERERTRAEMGEAYRTVLGHLRHEIGHYLFTELVTPDDLQEVRAAFGDETTDYREALDRHYAEGPPEGWEGDFVSSYATMHPAEDWAETFAHYLHIRATLETAGAYGVRVDGPSAAEDPKAFAADPAATDTDDLRAVIATWLPLTYALNAVNRSMGGRDLYPFVLPDPVIAKLGIVHRLVVRQRRRTRGPQTPQSMGFRPSGTYRQ